MPERTVYRWDLTPHERAALMTVVSGYIRSPDAAEVSIDAATGHEIEIGSLLTRLMDLQPLRAEDSNG